MQFNISQAQFGVRPSVTLPNPEFLKVVGEDGLRKIISDHYDLIRKVQLTISFQKMKKSLNKQK